jgi:GMP synthase (glutamine-hydrolysing)
MSNIHTDKILILDFGSQYTQLIARRIREIGVYCEIWAWDHDPAEITKFAPKGVILSGGPESTVEAGSPRAPEQAFALGAPVLGICYGMQTMAMQLGGKVEGDHAREFGHATIATETCTLFEGTPGKQDVWMSHGDRVTAMPPGFTLAASTESVPIAAMADESHHRYGLQSIPKSPTPSTASRSCAGS